MARTRLCAVSSSSRLEINIFFIFLLFVMINDLLMHMMFIWIGEKQGIGTLIPDTVGMNGAFWVKTTSLML